MSDVRHSEEVEEASLRASLLMLDCVRVGVMVVDEQRHLRYANPLARRWISASSTGVEPGELFTTGDEHLDRRLASALDQVVRMQEKLVGPTPEPSSAPSTHSSNDPSAIWIVPLHNEVGGNRNQPEEPPRIGFKRGAAGHPTRSSLSKRESQVLDLISRGFTYAEIGVQASVSISTVQTHVRSIYTKLGVHSKTEAVFEARLAGLLR